MSAGSLGLDLDPIRPAFAAVLENGESVRIERCRADFPPAFVPPPLRGGPLAIDCRWPARPEGAGLSHREDPTKARIPLAYVWELLHAHPGARLKFEADFGSDRGTSITDALGEAVAHFMLECTNRAAARISALVVPNDIEEDVQENLLRAARRALRDGGARHTVVELVWRPVAAALRWLERFAPVLGSVHGCAYESIGQLLHLHLGFEGYEATVLDVVPHEENGTIWLLPGRRAPRAEDRLQQVPLCDLEVVASRLPGVAEVSDDQRARAAWNALWVSPLLQDIGTYGRAASSMPPWMSPSLVEAARASMLQVHGKGDATHRWFEPLRQAGPSSAAATLDAWLAHVASTLQGPLLGAVLSGPLTSMLRECSAFTESVQRVLPPVRVLLEGRDDDNILGQGANIYAARRTRNEPTYLDTLPAVSIIVVRDAEPVWEDLLKSEAPWVLGGQTWRSHPRGVRFQIDRGQTDLDLVVHREGAATCKKVAARFEYPTSMACPVSLSIEMEPGQGNARIEVVPAEKLLFRGRSLYLDWKTAASGGSPDYELEQVPRICPPHEPRLPSRSRWLDRSFRNVRIPEGKGSRALILNYLHDPSAWSRYGEKELASFSRCLRERGSDLPQGAPKGAICTAVSSDGEVAGGADDQALLLRFVELVVDRIRAEQDVDVQRECLKLLAGVSTADERALQLLRKALHQRHLGATMHYRRAVVSACASCFRAREDLELFFDYFDRVHPDYVDAEALACIVMYRRSALEAVASARVERWLKKLVPMLGSEPVGRRAQLPSSRSALAIGYLLRRRSFDGGFLELGSEMHGMVTRAVECVYRQPEPSDTAGVRRTLDALQRVRDYIDKKGRGRLTALLDENDNDPDDA